MSTEKQIEVRSCEDCLHYRACLVNSEYVPTPCCAYENKAGYRKQSEIIMCKDCAFGEIDAEGSGSIQCQNRDTPWRRYKEEFVMSQHDYCSYARAKMKDGAE